MRKLTHPVLATGAAALLAATSLFALAQAQPARGPGSAQAQIEAQARPGADRHRQQAQQQADATIDREAVAVVTETQGALKAIAANNKTAAIAALERATGKANILIARNPAAALIPTDVEVEVVDMAPADLKNIDPPNVAMLAAVAKRDYPRARVLLDSLRSEIRVRTYNLPLATYPAALREAARLVETGRNPDAAQVLLTALNTEVVVDRTLPLPLLNAQDEVAAATALRARDKPGAVRHLDAARLQLKRAQALGYGDPASVSRLEKQIDTLQAQLRGPQDSGPGFDRLRAAVSDFFNKQSATPHR